ncbi:hypothetical protein KUV26_03735 [Leisingera daeponensis]|uniref:Helix-turn-helix domain-containing protein n=1 Tax=Leisingera daeponensis TaxID=405746 RepID=A0ABS7NBF5_9RHOB|nr:hypothetical protein [Leisingera daeponensis]MBY6138537.1 hypothetical protein [Leisingera daeponensis]
MAEQEFDLFGDPVRLANGRRGRPAHVATQENRNKVIMLLAFGWGNERIAAALRITQPTLRKYYFSELKARDIQRDRLDLKRYMQVFEAAEQGNVGAMRLLEQLIAKSDLALTTGRINEAQRKSSAKPETPGKKAQERLDAHNVVGGDADSGWGDDIKPGSGMH